MENFGTRQSKGFGSFSLSSHSQKDVEAILEKYMDIDPLKKVVIRKKIYPKNFSH